MKKGHLYLLLLIGAVIAITASVNIVLAVEPTYKGAEFCGVCHAEEYESWSETGHANAAGLNEDGTYWVHDPDDPSRNRGELDAFKDSCANCHTLNWDGEAKTFEFDDTDPEKGLGIQCEECHGPYQAHSADNPAMTLDYTTEGCGECHVQPTDHAKSRHSTTMEDLLDSGHPSDSCLHCMSTQGFIGQEVTLETEGLASLSCAACHDPHSDENHYQLRYEDPDELCGACHEGSHHPQSEVYPDSAHDTAEVECVDCHGSGERFAHGHIGEWFNHTFGIYNTFYPYNQSEPMVCGNCHELEWATERLEYIEGLTEEFITGAEHIVEAAMTTIEEVNATEGIDAAKVSEAMELADEALGIVDYVSNDASGGLHNTERMYIMLNDAVKLAGEAETAALDAKSAVLTANVGSLTSEVDSLTTQVSTLESENSELAGKAASTTTNMVIGAVAGLVIGAVAVFFLTKKQ